MAAEVAEEVQAAVDQQAEDVVKEITLDLQDVMLCQTQAQAAVAAEETQAVQESVKLPIG